LNSLSNARLRFAWAGRPIGDNREAIYREILRVVPRRGLEPPRPCGHCAIVSHFSILSLGGTAVICQLFVENSQFILNPKLSNWKARQITNDMLFGPHAAHQKKVFFHVGDRTMIHARGVQITKVLPTMGFQVIRKDFC